MNVHQYYQLILTQEQSMPSEYVWMTSLSSRNGGVEGRVCEVKRRGAAKLVVDGTARIATAAEISDERARLEAKNRRASTALCTNFVVASSGEQRELGD